MRQSVINGAVNARSAVTLLEEFLVGASASIGDIGSAVQNVEQASANYAPS